MSKFTQAVAAVTSVAALYVAAAASPGQPADANRECMKVVVRRPTGEYVGESPILDAKNAKSLAESQQTRHPELRATPTPAPCEP
jgi:hypothetical protein